MEQKTKVIISVSLAAVLVLGIGFYLFQKNKSVQKAAKQPVQTAEVSRTTNDAINQQQPKPEDQISIVEGKMVSINEKQLYLKLEDGKGVAVNIDARTPVKVSGQEKVGNLSDLKVGDSVIANVDAESNAKDIAIKK